MMSGSAAIAAVAAAASGAASSKRPTPEQMRVLAEEGKTLPALVPRVAELERTLEEHEEWVASARELLGPKKPPKPPEPGMIPGNPDDARGSGAELAKAALEAATDAEAAERRRREKKKKGGKGGKAGAEGAKASGADAAALDAAQKRAEAERAERTLERVAERLAEREAALAAGEDGGAGAGPVRTVPARPSMARVAELCAAGEGLPLKSEEGTELAAAAQAAAGWTDRLKKLVVRPRSSAGAHAIAVDDAATALRLVADSIRAAISDLEGTGEPPESEEGQFCLCRQPGGREMLGCDECGDWYHLRCAQVTANFARTAKHYVCQACRAAKGDVFKLHRPDASTHRHIHRTRRPSLASLGELLLEAMDFVGEAPEEALIADVFREHARWRRAVKAAKARRESIVGVETAARAAKEAWEAAEALAAVPRDARRARIQEVSDRAAAVQHAQLLAGTTAMAAALLGAGGQGTAATALEATQRAAHMAPEQQLDALGQQVAVSYTHLTLPTILLV